jgi:hypothetical protein
VTSRPDLHWSTPARSAAAGTFAIGQAVRYQPGSGTYGYEDALEVDGRLPGIVVGFSPTRVRVTLTLHKRGRGVTVTRCVDATSLEPA